MKSEWPRWHDPSCARKGTHSLAPLPIGTFRARMPNPETAQGRKAANDRGREAMERWRGGLNCRKLFEDTQAGTRWPALQQIGSFEGVSAAVPRPQWSSSIRTSAPFFRLQLSANLGRCRH